VEPRSEKRWFIGPRVKCHRSGTDDEPAWLSATEEMAAVRDASAQEVTDRQRRIRGCLLGGALGDALGATVEFDRYPQVEALTDGRFTDDTQMTLFTAEGLIRAHVRGRLRGIYHPAGVVGHAYRRWLFTQGVSWRVAAAGFYEASAPDGWLVTEALLHERRAPGNTCLAALERTELGTIEKPINDSKGCGAVMRAAPCGFWRAPIEVVFELGCEVGALTHGHPSGYLPAGVLAATISGLLDGLPLAGALEGARGLLASRAGADETETALESAIALAAAGPASRQKIEQLGNGWTGDEALAIALCCALGFKDVRQGLLAAVNHSGDSDSTGSICGNLLGALHGPEALPAEWLERLAGRDVIEAVAEDAWCELVAQLGGDQVPERWWERYPGW